MRSVFEQITQDIVALIEAGAGAYQMPWHCVGSVRPVNAAGQAYRGINVLLLWAEAQRAGYSTATWGTYRQWQQLGAQVRRGARSTVVLLWKPIDAPGNDAEPDDGRRRRFMARAFRVFNAAQVDGYEVVSPPPLPEDQRISRAERFFAPMPAQIWSGGDTACYDPRSDLISMPSFHAFRSAEAYYSVLAHELTHWTGVKSRLARDLSGRFGSEAYAFEELVAELGAAFVSAQLGLSNEPRRDHAAYIGSWLRVLKGDPRAILTAASHAQAASDYLQAAAGTKPEETPAALGEAA